MRIIEQYVIIMILKIRYIKIRDNKKKKRFSLEIKSQNKNCDKKKNHLNFINILQYYL